MIRRADIPQVLQSLPLENFAINARVKRQAELATDLIFSIFLFENLFSVIDISIV
jgi:hypothetical protein